MVKWPTTCVLHLASGTVYCSIVQAASKGYVSHSNPSQLQEHGRHIQISLKWAESFLRRLRYVKRKATKAAQKQPPNLDNIKSPF